MNNLFEKLSSALSPLVLLISRVVIGYLILLHGLQKLTGDMPLLSLMGVGGLIETVGGALIILGLFTRASAFLLAGQMTVAFNVPRNGGDFLQPDCESRGTGGTFRHGILIYFRNRCGKILP